MIKYTFCRNAGVALLINHQEKKMSSVVSIARILSLFLLLVFSQPRAQTVNDYFLENLGSTDTYIVSSAPNNIFSNDQNFITGGWGDIYISMLKFNIASLPSVSAGDRVSVWFYNKRLAGNTATPTQVNIGLLASDFSNTTTWNNSGLSWYTQTVRPVNVNPYDYWTEFVITDYYNYWKSGVANFGFALVPVNANNNFNFFQSSSISTPVNQKPILRITKALPLKWPLSTAYTSRVMTQSFGSDWAGGTTCSSTGVVKKHNGADYSAVAGSSIYAAESGIVKAKFLAPPWESVITIEHTKPDGSKFTTSYWHVTPYVNVGNTVNKGDQIAVVANLGSNTHFHFGIRNGAHLINSSGKDVSSAGALPQTNCDGWPAFPENFIDPESNQIKFQ